MDNAKAAKTDFLPHISIAYLSLPVLIFFVGWLRPGLNIFFPALLLFLLWRLFKQLPHCTLKRGFSWLIVLSAIAFATYMVLISGQGQLTFQRPDYVKHNLVVHDLVEKSWPVVYEGGLYLCYYVAWYLPAALVGKLFGIASASWAMAIWSVSGLSLAFLWILKIAGKGLFFIILSAFVLFGSFDLPLLMWNYTESGNLGWLIWGNEPSVCCCPPLNINYDSPATNFYWAPQHSITAWLVSPLILYLHRQKLKHWLPMVLTLSLLWSPLVGIGLLVFTLCVAFSSPFYIKDYFKPEALITAALLAIPLISYFAGHLPMEERGLIFNHINILSQAWYFLLFWAMEFLVLYILMRMLVRKHGWQICCQKTLFYSVLVLFFLPFYWMGVYNDFPMRVSMPFTWLLALFAGMVLRRLIKERKRDWLSLVFVSFLLLSAYAPLREHLRGWVTGQDERMILLGQMPEKASLLDVNRYHNRYDPRSVDIQDQYFGREGSRFYHFFFGPY